MEGHLLATLEAVLSCPVKWGYFSDGETLPRVTLFRKSGRRHHTLNTKGLMRGAVQIDCWGEAFAAAIGASRLVSSELEGYRGGPILSARLNAVRDSGNGDADLVHRVSLTFAITYRE